MNDVTDLPNGLTCYISKTTEAYVQSSFAYSGKTLRVKDEDGAGDPVSLRGPLVNHWSIIQTRFGITNF